MIYQRFDNAFFNISPREANSMDPQQRILLHAAQEAFEDAGYVADSSPSFQRASTGCYIGLATGDYTDNLRDDIGVFYSSGTLRAFHSGRISYYYKLSGPSIVTDTACSSSMVSIYQACRALQNGDCTAAIAGGVNLITSPDVSTTYAHFTYTYDVLTYPRCT
jgi:acyl transferase domain-containing protein